MELRYISKPLLIGAVCEKPTTQYILRQTARGGRRPGTALWCVFYRRLNSQAAADAQRSLIIDRCMVIPVQIIPNAAVPLVWAFPMNLFHQLGNALVLGDTHSGFPGAPLIVASPGNMQRMACRANWKALLFRAATYRLILSLLPILPQRSPLSNSFTFFRRYNSIFSNSFSRFNRAFSIRSASSFVRGA